MKEKAGENGSDYSEGEDEYPGDFEKQIIDKNLIQGKNKSRSGQTVQDKPRVGVGRLATEEPGRVKASVEENAAKSPSSGLIDQKEHRPERGDNNQLDNSQQHPIVQVLTVLCRYHEGGSKKFYACTYLVHLTHGLFLT